MLLSDKIAGRDNNFNLIRLLAACFVVFSHSYSLTNSDPDVLSQWLGYSIASLGVDMFFVISGFLVTRSFLRTRNLFVFAVSRILRIYPGLIVCCFLTVLALGPFFTILPIKEYFAHQGVYEYLFAKSTIFGVLVTGGGSELPGIFESNPHTNRVNASLWTLVYEVFMYGLIFVFGVISMLFRDRDGKVLVICYVAMILVCLFMAIVDLQLVGKLREAIVSVSRFGLCFFTGGLMFIFNKKIPLSPRVFLIVLVVAIVSLHIEDMKILYYFSVAYVAVFCAYYVRTLKSVIQKDDYSYGVYIYAFPIQQAVISITPNISGWALQLVAMPIIAVVAYLSWHLIEKRFIRLKESWGAR
jgi:peptidoglycan/LPS O-acetylase OafA/YrhL